LEAAGGSNTSVYVGSLSQEYSSLSIHDEEASATYQATGLSKAMLSNRLSWFYDLRGPSMTIDTACSSSLIGIHLACQSLMLGESEMVGFADREPLLGYLADLYYRALWVVSSCKCIRVV
jgi:acyl transferase domain-containing protein